jgi:AcrR family transcriptional regulator
MNATAGTGTGPRAEAQRDRILCAALTCFIEDGFHGASMARIAETAQMSAGLMYRYFENKNAIVLGIIARQLEESRTNLRQLQSSNNVATGLVAAFERWCLRDSNTLNPALFLEISVEATRNPALAEALRTFDASMRDELFSWLTRERSEGGIGLPTGIAAERALALQCFIDGLAMRSAREPDLDRDQLRAAVQDMVDKVTRQPDIAAVQQKEA